MPPPDSRLVFTCRLCREPHTASLAYHSEAPHATAAIRSPERIAFTTDQCVIDASSFYLRGRILLPVHGLPDPLVWGCWAEISPTNFVRTNELWQSEGRESQPPFPGWLESELPLYPSTLNLTLDVHTQPVGRRPHFTVTAANHPLAVEQRDGISLDRLYRIAEHFQHPGL